MTDTGIVQAPSIASSPTGAALFASMIGEAQWQHGFDDRSVESSRGVSLETLTDDIGGERPVSSPGGTVTHRAFELDGLTVEIVRATKRGRMEVRFNASRPMLIICDEGDANASGASVRKPAHPEPRKTLTFIPAGQEYHRRQESRGFTRFVYFYFDPAKAPFDTAANNVHLARRLQFEDVTLWNIALKIAALVEQDNPASRHYLEALGTVLAHELTQIGSRTPLAQPPARGGLAAWQQRIVATYIEEHIAEQISLTALASLVQLSPWHFCRAFRESFGVPPHRYHNSRRIECAKALLAGASVSVTEIGYSLGFSETSAFSTAFRRATGLTPTMYQRSLT